MVHVKKNMKRVAFLICMLICFCASYKITLAGVGDISGSKWKSNLDIGGYWSEDPYIYPVNMSSSYNIVPYVNTARSKWAEEVDSNITTTPTNADVIFYGGSSGVLNGIGFIYYEGIYGLTLYQDYTQVSIDGADYYTIWSLEDVIASVCTDYGTEIWNNAVLHEYGHALGWHGHSSCKEDVMWSGPVQGNTNLTENDKIHIKQIYEAMR